MTNMLRIQIVDSPDEAPNYQRDTPDVRTATIHTAVIVLKGTESGYSTVDFQIKDAEGNEFVAMLTGTLVCQLASAIVGAEQR